MTRNRVWPVIASAGGIAFFLVAILKAPGIWWAIVALLLAFAYTAASRLLPKDTPTRRDRL